jgi:hypothetical protein
MGRKTRINSRRYGRKIGEIFINIKDVWTRGAWMMTMEVFDDFIECRRDVGKRDPRIFGLWKGFPLNEIFKAMTNLATIC